MGISPIRLFYLLLSSFFLGIGMGALYDVHRIVRVLLGVRYSKSQFSEQLFLQPLPILGRPLGEIRQGKIKKVFLSVLIFLQDVAWFMIAGFGVVILNYAWNDGRFRFYTVISLFVGFFLYFFTVGKLVIRLSEWIVYVLRAVVSIVFFLCSRPFVKAFEVLKKIMKKIIQNLRKSIANRRKKVYNINKKEEYVRAADRGFL